LIGKPAIWYNITEACARVGGHLQLLAFYCEHNTCRFS